MNREVQDRLIELKSSDNVIVTKKSKLNNDENLPLKESTKLTNNKTNVILRKRIKKKSKYETRSKRSDENMKKKSGSNKLRNSDLKTQISEDENKILLKSLFKKYDEK